MASRFPGRKIVDSADYLGKDSLASADSIGSASSLLWNDSSEDYFGSDSLGGSDVSPDLATTISTSISSTTSSRDSLPEWYTRLFAGKTLIRKSENELLRLPAEKALNPKNMLALYFGAGWSVPCSAFLPRLVDFHYRLHPMFEIVYVSSDLSQADMSEQMLEFHGDWLGLPIHDILNRKLIDFYEVTSMPTVLVLDRDAMIFCRDGHKEILTKGLYAFYKWAEEMEYPEG